MILACGPAIGAGPPTQPFTETDGSKTTTHDKRGAIDPDAD